MSADTIKELRNRTGAGILDCKKALAENDGDIDKAIDWLRAKGIAKAAKKADRIAAEGVVHAYIHGGGRIGVLIEVNCETDFVAINEDFRKLVHDISMHIAFAAPTYVSREEVSAAELDREREVQRARVLEEGKPAHVADKIVEGRLVKYYEQVCLLEQRFVKDEDKTINQVLLDAMARIGENLRVRRFVRWEVGEGLEKRSTDFAAEVAAQVGSA